MTAFFRIVGPIDAAETIAEGRGIQELGRLTKAYGPGNWRKRKGFAEVRFADGSRGAPKYIGTKRMASGRANSS